MKTKNKPNQLRIVANLIYTGLVLLITCSETTMADEPWKTLFDGESLQGWVQRGGKARYTAEDGQIIGTTVFRTPNSFLCTQATYSDFILEVEFKVAATLNSGIQIRSSSYPEYRRGVVHGYQIEIDPSERSWNKEKQGQTVRWRNIRIITDNPVKYSRPTPLAPRDMFNKLTSNEKSAGWKLLFDGKTTKGWRGAKLDHFPKFGWEIKDGILTVLESGGDESRNGGDIVTIDKYSDFELWVDFKITAGANSGIKYFVNTMLNKSEGSAIGLEYQLLDDQRHPDAKKGSHQGSRTLASLYDLIKAENKHPSPIGQWNHARVSSKANHVEHWLNGRKVLEYERKSDRYRKLVAESKYKTWPSFGESEQGNILLQDHGNRVSFRNIKIRLLDKNKK